MLKQRRTGREQSVEALGQAEIQGPEEPDIVGSKGAVGGD